MEFHLICTQATAQGSEDSLRRSMNAIYAISCMLDCYSTMSGYKERHDEGRRNFRNVGYILNHVPGYNPQDSSNSGNFRYLAIILKHYATCERKTS
jgi:hypothetical protein